MKFTEIEIIAIIKVTYRIILADGIIKKEQTNLLTQQLLNLKLSHKNIDDFMKLSEKMSEEDSYIVLSGMSNNNKKYIMGFLMGIIISGGEKDACEIHAWKSIKDRCNFPEIDMSDALQYWVLT